jgi:Leucine-rich repeat (LRR) protein
VSEGGATEMQRDFAIGKFCQTLALFGSLESLEFENVTNIGQILAFLNKLPSERIMFLRTLKFLNINACPITEEEQDSAFIELKEFVIKCNKGGHGNLEALHLKALRIGEKIGDLVAACKNAQIKDINLEYNGIEPDFCLYIQMIVNFETLERLDLSHNWVGHIGLEHMKDHFRSFKRLKALNLSSNKLFMMPDRRTECLRDMLFEVRNTLEELNLAENSMENSDFEILLPVLSQMPKLRYLNLNVNRIWSQVFRKFLDYYISAESLNNLALETLLMKQNDLRDDGVADLFERI